MVFQLGSFPCYLVFGSVPGYLSDSLTIFARVLRLVLCLVPHLVLCLVLFLVLGPVLYLAFYLVPLPGSLSGSLSRLFQYRNESFQSDIFFSDIGITDVDVGCQISQT
jgi:hypothetical protein